MDVLHFKYDFSSTYSSPASIVRMGNKVLYRGADAAKWLKNQKDRNIKSCAKLSYN